MFIIIYKIELNLNVSYLYFTPILGLSLFLDITISIQKKEIE